MHINIFTKKIRYLGNCQLANSKIFYVLVFWIVFKVYNMFIMKVLFMFMIYVYLYKMYIAVAYHSHRNQFFQCRYITYLWKINNGWLCNAIFKISRYAKLVSQLDVHIGIQQTILYDVDRCLNTFQPIIVLQIIQFARDLHFHLSRLFLIFYKKCFDFVIKL